MRETVGMGVAVALVVAPVIAVVAWSGQGDAGADAAGGGIALVKSDEESVAAGPDGSAFELEIDPELDAAFGPRPVNAVEAAQIVVERFGGQVVKAELDEEDGRPIWEMELAGSAVGEVDVDAINGRIR